MHRPHHRFRIARQKRHVRPAFSRSPDPGEGEQWVVVLVQPKPYFRLALGHRIGLGGPFAKARYRDDAAPLAVAQRRAPERTVEIADVGHRPPVGRRRTRETPRHRLKLQPARIAAPKHRCGAARVNLPQRRKIVAVAIERAEQAPHFLDSRGHCVKIAHSTAPAAHCAARFVVNTGNKR